MDKESWFTAQKAKEHGFIDEVMFEQVQLVASSYSGMLPPEVIQTMRNSRLKQHEPEAGADEVIKARLKLMKLKGETE